jgi:hypothetical protein
LGVFRIWGTITQTTLGEFAVPASAVPSESSFRDVDVEMLVAPSLDVTDTMGASMLGDRIVDVEE